MTDLILYTPGHNIYTDTLIMHGIIRLLAEKGCTKGRVRRIGEAYMIQYRNCPHSGSIVDTASLRILSLHLMMLKSKRAVNALYLQKLQIFNTFSANSSYINELTTNSLSIDISKYSGAKGLSHRVFTNEGRGRGSSKGSNNMTIYLPLCPLCGKYSTLSEFRAGGVVQRYKSSEQYKVCRDCFVLALLGFIWATSMLSFKAKDKQVAYVFTVAPLEARIADVLLFQRAFGDPGVTYNWTQPASDLPATAAALAFASILDVPLRRGVSIGLLQWRLERRRQQKVSFVQPMLPFGRLLVAMASLRYVAPEWPRFIKQGLRDKNVAGDVVELLEELYTAIALGSLERLYNAARLLASIKADAYLPVIPGRALLAALEAAQGEDSGRGGG